LASVEGLSVLQAVVDLAEEFVEQVAVGGGATLRPLRRSHWAWR
jgi:hypothetical protein